MTCFADAADLLALDTVTGSYFYPTGALGPSHPSLPVPCSADHGSDALDRASWSRKDLSYA